MRTTRAILLLALLLAALAAPAAADAAIRLGDVGIADQKSDMFSDPRFAQLGIKRARIDVAYDVLLDAGQTAALDQWMAAAQAGGVRVLVTFDRSRRPGRKTFRPDTHSLVKQFNRLRARYPFVKEWVTWNEPNLSQTASRTARQWLALRKACRSCTIVAADLVDRPNLSRWARAFVKTAHRQPKIWGLHNYADANQYRPRATKALLKAVKGKIWFTETGGVVRRRNGSSVKYTGESLTHAAKAIDYIFTKLVRLSPRIGRVYVFHWNGRNDSWDSALISPNGGARPAFAVLANLLRHLRR
jgi:polysaccharide biosynthesis protein PslG